LNWRMAINKNMEIKLEIPDYDKTKGFQYHWEDGFEITVVNNGNSIAILANKEGLISLAVQMLTLAQETVPLNKYINLDEYGGLEDGSNELIIQKI